MISATARKLIRYRIIGGLMLGLPAVVHARAAVTISLEQTQSITCDGGICAPTAKDAVLNVNDLENLLASGNVEVTTTGAGVEAHDIVVTAPLSWSNSSALTLDAHRSITVNKPVSVEGVSALSLATGGKGGTLSFGTNGNVTFANLSANLTINGESCALVNSIDSLFAAMQSDPGGCFAIAQSFRMKGSSGGPIFQTLSGKLEGLGNRISNLKLQGNHTRNAYNGFFGEIESGAVVENLGIVNADISSPGRKQYVGILAAVIDIATIHGVFVSGTLKGGARSDLGGLAALSEATIDHSHASIVAQDEGYAIGGLMAFSDGPTSFSYATGQITVLGKYEAFVGGISASNGGAMDSCYSNVAVSAPNNIAGGLVGTNYGAISNSYATGAVSNGIDSYTGGLVGSNFATISDSYSAGSVTAGDDGYVGGLIGSDSSSSGSLSDTYWDLDLSGITDPSQGAGNISNDPGITGLSTEQLQSGLPEGFNPKVWNETSSLNNGLPYLRANPPKK